ncbi:hypothetical protein Smp_102000 [Schistosoma mansoni]|uniref:Uncharacterized protein n=1 Tax=Schistosoma mansoni TaxID=6183 RepID=G4VEA7_SCHMA|nr:hypothetical protein Smp_102000 [Schistosoma mansoni]|eukprot:XP_018649747.1 hypothetical protein Smp_102000 [Schistosoma mansoni]
MILIRNPKQKSKYYSSLKGYVPKAAYIKYDVNFDKCDDKTKDTFDEEMNNDVQEAVDRSFCIDGYLDSTHSVHDLICLAENLFPVLENG